MAWSKGMELGERILVEVKDPHSAVQVAMAADTKGTK